VLSPSTEAYDRGEKFEHYRSIDSLQTYVLISQSRPHIEVYERQDNGAWMLTEISGLDSRIDIASIACVLDLSDVYELTDSTG
jgi:Uma2 family endonuclease